MGEKKLVNYMTLKEASVYTSIPVGTLREKVYQKLVPAYKPGKSLLFKQEDLDNFITRFKV